MKKEIYWSLLMCILLFPIMAFAQIVLPGTVDGEVNYAALIQQLIANPKSFTVAIIGALLILAFVQACKKFGFKLMAPQKQLFLLVVLGQVYSFLVSVFILKDVSASAAVVGMFSSGGAMMIFNHLQLAFPKLFPKSSLVQK